MKIALRFSLFCVAVFALTFTPLHEAEAGIFGWCKKKACCEEAEPECCEPAPCEPAPACEPEPVCCEEAVEPTCCEEMTEPSCCESGGYPLPPLAEGEILISVSPIDYSAPVGVVVEEPVTEEPAVEVPVEAPPTPEPATPPAETSSP